MMEHCQDKELKVLLMKVVNTLNRHPRLVETLVFYLKDKNINKDSTISIVDCSFMHDLLDYLFKRTVELYAPKVNEQVLSAIVFHRPESLNPNDKETSEAILSSVISNPIENTVSSD